MAWTDNFTHDYYADSTYTPFGFSGSDGSDFTIGGGQLVAETWGQWVAWADERAPARTGILEMDIADLAALGVSGGAVNLSLNSGVANFPTAQVELLEGGEMTCTVGDGGANVAGGTDTLAGVPSSGPATFRVEIQEDQIIATIVGVGSLSWSLVPGDPGVTGDPRSLLDATTLDPTCSVISGPPWQPHVTLTRWYYSWGSSGPPPPPDGSSITVSAAPSVVAADGVSHAYVTAHVSDPSGAPLVGQVVTFDPGGQFGPTTDNGDGSYTAMYTSTTVVGTVPITAHDGSLSAETVIEQVGPAPPAAADGTANAGVHTTAVVHLG
jgi:hypothetical protein